MSGEFIEIIVDEGRLINAIQDHSREDCGYNQTRDGQDFAKGKLLPNSNVLGQVPATLSLVVLPRVHVFWNHVFGSYTLIDGRQPLGKVSSDLPAAPG